MYYTKMIYKIYYTFDVIVQSAECRVQSAKCKGALRLVRTPTIDGSPG